MNLLDFVVQRYAKGHAQYSDVPLWLNPQTAVYSNFGQIVDAQGKEIHKTMERRDTLIPEGTYPYDFYYSPENEMWVLRLRDVPGFNFIEHHPANWVCMNGKYLLKGCTSHGLSIDTHTPAILNCRTALNPWFAAIVKASGKILAGPPGTVVEFGGGSIKYETLQQ